MKLEYGNALITERQVLATAEMGQKYTDLLKAVRRAGDYARAEGFLNLVFDENIVTQISKLVAAKKNEKLKYIVVVGIGGSNLGTQAIYEAVRGQYDQLSKEYPKIIFADTVASKLLENIVAILQTAVASPEEVLVNLISKSGTTTESVADFEIICKGLMDKLGSAMRERLVITTGTGSKLHQIAQAQGLALLEIPEKVVGRFSVFSAVGLLPLSLAGLDVVGLRAGAGEMLEKCLSADGEKNWALLSAGLKYQHFQDGILISNNFFFNPELESLGKWYRQLLAESIGKEYNQAGEKINAGITPLVSVGSTDLHSMAQLYLGGPADKFTTFVYAPQPGRAIVAPSLILDGLLGGIGGKDSAEIMDAIYAGVKMAYQKRKLPYDEIGLAEISEKELGAFMMLKMLETTYLAQFIGVNAFDQPSVEEYKEEMRKILQK